MNRETRDKFVVGTQKDLTSGNACLETPPAIFIRLNDQFGPFDIDLTADAQRTLLPKWFGPGSPLGTNALTAFWRLHGKNGYSNPPYGAFVPWMLRKAKLEAAKGFESTLLLPVRMTKAFHTHVLDGAAEIWFADKRIVFWENGKPKLTQMKDGTWEPTTALFDSMIVRYAAGIRFSPPKVRSWKVPPHMDLKVLTYASLPVTVQPEVQVSAQE